MRDDYGDVMNVCLCVLPVGLFNSSVQPATLHGQLFLLGCIKDNWPHSQSLEGGWAEA